jgi:UDP-N-acetylglucosamine--N-acetylmuramyl-(pentapeptide) pyrophosphoryl-undecaprenol N-acetylglucosamine transferase
VPLPGAMDDHQTANAASLAASGGAWVIAQPGFNAEEVSGRIEALVRDPDALSVASAAARGRARLDAAERIADLVLELANQRLDSRAGDAVDVPAGNRDLSREWRAA